MNLYTGGHLYICVFMMTNAFTYVKVHFYIHTMYTFHIYNNVHFYNTFKCANVMNLMYYIYQMSHEFLYR